LPPDLRALVRKLEGVESNQFRHSLGLTIPQPILLLADSSPMSALAHSVNSDSYLEWSLSEA
jgi:hypothetical protein